ncbi:MAG: hypothetical protein HY866_21415, partial [Chloroflexi bacterium]|nr:hypothetical protein [Chloroflexota bacterium]
MRMHKAGILCAIVIFGLLLSGCSSDNEPKIPKPQGTVTFPAIAWQRPAEPISQSRPLVRLTGVMRWHQSTVNDIAFSANNTRLASIGADSTLVVWNLANGESLASQSNVDGRRVFWGPEDQTILTVTNEGFIRVWALKVGPSLTLEEQAHFAGHDSPVQTMAQSPDHSLFAVGAENGEIKLWQIPEGNTMTVIPAHNNSVVFLAFSPDGQRLVSISLNQGIMVWSVP